MIPKIIHYCWYGGAEIPAEYRSFIEEWKQINPDYEIIRWDESNSPMKLPYLKTALQHKNWANMSNLVRFHALIKHGGIYLDTDMKLLKPLDSLLENKCFFGFEEGGENSDVFWVNNAIMGGVSGQAFLKLCYEGILEQFDGTEQANMSAPRIVTDLLKKKRGLKKYGDQLLKDVRLYPIHTFYPVHYSKVFELKDKTISYHPDTIGVHTWARTWLSKETILDMHDRMQHQLANSEAQILQLNASINTLEQQVAFAEDGLRQKETQLREKESLLEEKELFSAHLQQAAEEQKKTNHAQLADLNAQIRNLQAQCNLIEKEKDAVSAELEQIKRELGQVQEGKSRIEEKYAELRLASDKQIANHQANIASLNEKLGGLKENVRILTAESLTKDEQMQRNAEQNDKREQEINRLLDELRQQIDALKTEGAGLKAENALKEKMLLEQKEALKAEDALKEKMLLEQKEALKAEEQKRILAEDTMRSKLDFQKEVEVTLKAEAQIREQQLLSNRDEIEFLYKANANLKEETRILEHEIESMIQTFEKTISSFTNQVDILYTDMNETMRETIARHEQVLDIQTSDFEQRLEAHRRQLDETRQNAERIRTHMIESENKQVQLHRLLKDETSRFVKEQEKAKEEYDRIRNQAIELQKSIEWYQNTYEKRSLIGVIKHKLLKRSR
jgi:hypothetical protein